ncbi:MAG: TlpA family protein disulfide reductase [Flavobacteriales bacterium Tduv]
MKWRHILDIIVPLIIMWWIIYTPPGNKIRQNFLNWLSGEKTVNSNKNISPRNVLIESDFQSRLRAMDGSIMDFSQARGKVILMHFLSSSCELCLQKIALMQDLYDTYKDKVTFLLVSKDEKQDKVFEFMRTNGYTINVYYPIDPPIDKLIKTDKVSWIFIAKNGVISVEKLGTKTPDKNQVMKKLESLLAF